MRYLKTYVWAGWIALFSSLHAQTLPPSDSMALAQGLALFELHCASCHAKESDGIGPRLAGVVSATSEEWVAAFIRNPQKMIEQGDPRAQHIYKTYGVYMPGFEFLSEPEIQAIVDVLTSWDEGTSTPPIAPTHRSSLPLLFGGILLLLLAALIQHSGGKIICGMSGLLLLAIFLHQTYVSYPHPALGSPISDPVPHSWKHAGYALEVQDYVRLPRTQLLPPAARITAFFPGGGRQWLIDLRGKLYAVGQASAIEYLDVKQRIPNFISSPGLGTGLGSVAFHPDFSSNGLFYTTHTEPANSLEADFALEDSIPVALQWVLSAWHTPAPAQSTFVGTHRELLRVDMVRGAHGMQEIGFRPELRPGEADYGNLYIGIGDGGASKYGYSHVIQTLSRVWGTVLRIDPLGSNGRNGKYGIPIDNPFANDADPFTLEEIWAWGFRNPHRFTWDEGTFYIFDVGEANIEEINVGMAGANYGWDKREGPFVFDNKIRNLVYPVTTPNAEFTDPVAMYDHDEGRAIAGGFVYRGKNIPELQGKFVLGDIPTGHLFWIDPQKFHPKVSAMDFQRISIVHEGQVQTLSQLVGGHRKDLHLGQDEEGELYLLTKWDGWVRKITGVRRINKNQR